MLRVWLQVGAAGAMLSQREGVALIIGGVVMLLEVVQDRFSGGCGGSCCHPCRELVSRRLKVLRRNPRGAESMAPLPEEAVDDDLGRIGRGSSRCLWSPCRSRFFPCECEIWLVVSSVAGVRDSGCREDGHDFGLWLVAGTSRRRGGSGSVSVVGAFEADLSATHTLCNACVTLSQASWIDVNPVAVGDMRGNDDGRRRGGWPRCWTCVA
jgi:hypothetical protein